MSTHRVRNATVRYALGSLRCSTAAHEASCGIDLQAQTMEVGLFNRDSKIMPHRKMPTTPEAFLKAMAFSRQDLVVADVVLCPL